ncbi:MAG: tetratricopeptide repeat protein [Cyanobacteria bacterium SZAS-4]|nr:tetratricopeptide repeat protein [Cyanobacteria bacterium SZAS-4]
MNSDPRIELAFKDATDSESESVKLVTPDCNPERLSLDCDAAKEENEPGIQPSVNPQVLPAAEQEIEPAAEPEVVVVTESAVESGHASPGAPSSAEIGYSFARHYAFEPSRSSLFPDLKQVLNCAYFTAAALASADLVTTLNNHWLLVFPIIFSMFAVGAFVYSINQRVHISDFNVVFSQRTRFLIRAIALLIPIPIIAGAIAVRMSDHELDLANNAYDAEHYAQAIDHLNLAINLNPFNEGAYDAFSRVYFMQSAWGLANQYAQKAIALDPTDSYAWSDQARPLHMMQQNSEAILAAKKAVELDSTNGQAFSTLAESYQELGQYEAALEAAKKHAKIHNTEPYAFELTANILRKMGLNDEAAAVDAERGRLAVDEEVTP